MSDGFKDKIYIVNTCTVPVYKNLKYEINEYRNKHYNDLDDMHWMRCTLQKLY